MSTRVVQVRDVPSRDVDALRARAAAQGISLSAYLRELIHADATTAPMSEVLARIAERDPVEVDSATIRSLIAEDRR